MRIRIFIICRPKLALTGVGQPGGTFRPGLGLWGRRGRMCAGLLSVERAVCTWGTAPRGCPVCCYCLLGSTTPCGGLGGPLGWCVGLVYLSYGLRVRGVSPGFGTKPEMPLGVLQASQCYRLWLGHCGYFAFSATYCGYLQCGV